MSVPPEQLDLPGFRESRLVRACWSHDTASVIALLAAGEPVHPEANFGQNPLWVALSGEELPPRKLVKALLVAGLPPDAGGEGETPLQKITRLATERLMQYSRDLPTRQRLWPFLDHARSLIKLLGRHGANANRLDDLGRTPALLVAELFRAPNQSWATYARSLLQSLMVDAHADWRAQDAQGFSVLHHAAAARESRLISSLVKAGADPTDRNTNGQTPVEWLLATRAPGLQIPEFPEDVLTAKTLLALLRNGASRPSSEPTQPKLIQDLLGYLHAPANQPPPDSLLPLLCHWLPLLGEQSPDWWADLISKLLNPNHFSIPFEYSWGSTTILFKSHFLELLANRQDCPDSIKDSLMLSFG